jgi:predicted helicase
MENIIKGRDYEIYINDYLNSLDLVNISYLWKDIPEYVLFDYNFIESYNDKRLTRISNNINKLQDSGTDIIYINQEERCIIVQCKNYSKTNYIRIDNLSGFYYIMANHIDKNGEIYYTNKICKTIKNQNNNRIKVIQKEFIKESENKIILYDYQIEVINISKKYYENNDSGIISLPCGCGKTLIAYHISLSYQIVIMITPLRQYAQQNVERFK